MIKSYTHFSYVLINIVSIKSIINKLIHTQLIILGILLINLSTKGLIKYISTMLENPHIKDISKEVYLPMLNL